MRQNKLKELSFDDLPPSNIEEYIKYESTLEREFEFFRKYYDIYINVDSGQLVLTKQEYSNIFSQSDYWDKLYMFKDAFDSEYHFFSDRLYKIYISKLIAAQY